MLGDFRVDQFTANRAQRRQGALFVLAHQPRIAGDIGRQDRREPTFDTPRWRFHSHDATAICLILHSARARSVPCLEFRNALQDDALRFNWKPIWPILPNE